MRTSVYAKEKKVWKKRPLEKRNTKEWYRKNELIRRQWITWEWGWQWMVMYGQMKEYARTRWWWLEWDWKINGIAKGYEAWSACIEHFTIIPTHTVRQTQRQITSIRFMFKLCFTQKTVISRIKTGTSKVISYLSYGKRGLVNVNTTRINIPPPSSAYVNKLM